MRRPHLLYVAWGFPPCRAGGVYRALATANAFAADGWDVTVLTAPRETFLEGTGGDLALEELVDPDIDVVRVPFHWPAMETDLRRWSRTRVAFPRLWARVRKQRDLRVFPEVVYGPWRRELEAAAAAVHRDRPVDLVVATTNPQVAITAGLHLHETAGVPFVVDYRDAWSLNVFSGERVHPEGSAVHQWESRALGGAAEVWVVNEPLRAWHAQAYPDAQLHVVANGYDAEPAAPGPARDPLVFGYLGTVTDQVPMPAFVAGWEVALAGGLDARAVVRGYLGHYGTPRPALQELLERAGPLGVSYGGPVSKTAVSSAYGGFDALLLILGSGRYVTSGKVYEYVATGLPVVSVHDPGNAASDVLRGYPRWHPAASLEPGDIAAALLSAAEDARRPDASVVSAARAYGQQFQRSRQLAPRIASLRARVTPS